MVKVSVIIPVYNVEKYVKECLLSVMGQTLNEIEIICINDGSTDKSWEIVQELTAGDSRFILLENEKNSGLAYTRNRGLITAQGEYVYMLDSDDTIDEEALEQLFAIGKAEQLEVVVFSADLLFENDELKKKFSKYKKTFRQQYEEIMSGKDLFILLQENQDWISQVQRFFYKREFLLENEISFINGMVHEDEPFSFEVLMKATKVKCIKNAFFNRRFREESIMTGKKNYKNLEGYLMILCRIFQLQRTQKENTRLKQAIQRYIWNMYQKAVEIYRIIEGQILSEGFESSYEEVNMLFPLFRNINIGLKEMQLLQGGEIYRQLEDIETVYVYGAGVYAKRVLTFMEPFQIVVKGMLVKNKNNNPRAVNGIKVYEAESVLDRQTPVMIGVSDKFRKEVVEELKESGFENIFELKF